MPRNARARSSAGKRGKRKRTLATATTPYDPDAAYRAELDRQLYVCKTRRSAAQQRLTDAVEQAARLATATTTTTTTGHATSARTRAAHGSSSSDDDDGGDAGSSTHAAHSGAGGGATTCLSASELPLVVRSLGFCMTSEQLEQLSTMAACAVHGNDASNAVGHAGDNNNNGDDNTAAAVTCVDVVRLAAILGDVRRVGVLLYDPTRLTRPPHPCWPTPACTVVHMATDEAPLQASFATLWRACGRAYTTTTTTAAARASSSSTTTTTCAGEAPARCLRARDLHALLVAQQQAHPSLNALTSSELDDLCFALVDATDDDDDNDDDDDDDDGVVREDTYVHCLSGVY